MTGADLGRPVCQNGKPVVKWACPVNPVSALFYAQGETMQPAHMRRRPCLSLGVFCYLEFGGVKWQENLMRLRSR